MLEVGRFWCYTGYMFIRKVPHKDKKSGKKYFTYKLVESVRTERGPRQRDVLKRTLPVSRTRIQDNRCKGPWHRQGKGHQVVSQ